MEFTADDIIESETVWPRPRLVPPDVAEGGLAGIPLHRLDWQLQGGGGTVKNACARFYARFPRYVDSRVYKQTAADWWKHHWYDIPYEAMAQVFSPDELCRFMWNAAVQNEIEGHFQDRDEMHPLDHVLWKVKHSIWMWGPTDDYTKFVSFYQGLSRLSFGEGFEVRLDHTNSINERGTAVHTRHVPPKPVWLDGEFGLIVYYKGKHVLTVGFSATGAGVLIHQVQLREKTGNRFLYKLSKPYLEHTLDCFRDAFSDLPILLIDGGEAVERIRKVYGSRVKTDFDSTDAPARIRAFYDQPLRGWDRTLVEKGTYAKCYQVRLTETAAIAA